MQFAGSGGRASWGKEECDKKQSSQNDLQGPMLLNGIKNATTTTTTTTTLHYL